MITLKIHAFKKNQKMVRALLYILASFPDRYRIRNMNGKWEAEEREERTMKDFYFRMLTRIRYGIGISGNVAEFCKEQNGTKVFLMADKILQENHVLDPILKSFEDAGMEYVVFTDVVPEPPVDVVDRVSEVMKTSGCDICVSIGGGSTIDTAKAVCMLQTNEGSVKDYLFGGSRTVTNPSVPLICIPTTAGTGAEVTAASVIDDTENKVKLSVTHENLIPGLALLDPTLQESLPPSVTATTGMDALTHAIESYVSLNSNPIGDAYGLQTMRMIGANLRNAVANGADMEARGNMIIASLLGGAAILNCGLGVVHGIAQSIGGIAHVPHGLANALILPYAMEINYVGNLEKFKNIAVCLGENVEGLSLRDAAARSVKAIVDLENDIGIPRKLSEVGVTRDMFPQIIEDTMAYRLLAINPIKITRQHVEGILEAAY